MQSMLIDRRQAGGALLGAAASLALGARGQAQAQAPAPTTAPGPSAADDASAEVETARDRFEHLLAPVGVDGLGPFRFLLDTGANVSCVSSDLATRLKLPPAGLTEVHTAVGVKARPCVLISRLEVGARRRRNVRAAILPSLGKGIDGVLGVDWLGGQRLSLDFKAQSLSITRSRDDFSTHRGVVVPARRRLGQLTIVDADLSGRRISAMIDSGSQATICNKPLRDMVMAMEHGRPEERTRTPVRLESLAGEPFEGVLFYLPFLRLGGLQLGDVPTVYAETHIFEIWRLTRSPAIVLGMDLLTQFQAVSLDFGSSRVRFDLA